MVLPNADDILALPEDRVPEFIIKHRRARTLSVIVRDLNDSLADGDDTAAAALAHIGLLEVA
ncbi:hypothetical protein HKCCE3408_01015 [Rhodobacterales bacterium HKCCE3408]|nr:hypothetical protein [Rhodobacterales bacterium HKCCE3408]